jgi:hypothetical protein
MKKKIPRRETMDNGKNVDQYFRLTNMVAVDINTRIVNDEKGVMNIAEFINGCFPLMEALRNALRGNTCPVVATSAFAYATKDVIGDIMRFEEKWNLAYTSWFSAMKTRSNEAKKILSSGSPWLHTDLQTFLTNSPDIVEDIDLLVDVLRDLERNAGQIISAIADIRLNEDSEYMQRKWYQFF